MYDSSVASRRKATGYTAMISSLHCGFYPTGYPTHNMRRKKRYNSSSRLFCDFHTIMGVEKQGGRNSIETAECYNAGPTNPPTNC